jgi:hypothetical protein
MWSLVFFRIIRCASLSFARLRSSCASLNLLTVLLLTVVLEEFLGSGILNGGEKEATEDNKWPKGARDMKQKRKSDWKKK